MKQKIFFFLVIFAVGIICANLMKGVPQEEWDADNFGRVIGQIVDPETGNPVNSKFQICIFNWNYREDDYEFKMDCNFLTDEKGYIAINLPPGTYGLLFIPEDSKYSMTFHPFYEKMPEKYKERFSCPIIVEKGKITKFFKKAIIGGSIKVTLVDLTGNPVDPDIAFPGRKIGTMGTIKNYNLAPGSPSFDFSLKNGQYIQNGLFPDTAWEMKLEFYRIGYGIFEKKNIVIKANELTEITVAIDPDDITGVEGFIADELGNPRKGVRIDFYQKKKPLGGDFDCFTDSNGHYIMTGMPEGFYEIVIFDGHKYYFMYQNVIIEIKKNILLNKDFIIPPSDY